MHQQLHPCRILTNTSELLFLHSVVRFKVLRLGPLMQHSITAPLGETAHKDPEGGFSKAH